MVVNMNWVLTCTFMTVLLNVIFLLLQQSQGEEVCEQKGDGKVESCELSKQKDGLQKYTKWNNFLQDMERALDYIPCQRDNCSCHSTLIENDLSVWKNGIDREIIETAKSRGTHYQIINHRLYRDKECMFPFRCSGVEHFILEHLNELHDMEFVLNTRDWPQAAKHWQPLPIFSFSKTKEFWDITYPAWTFWEGGPAISLYPTGLGRWDQHRVTLTKASQKWPWRSKKNMGFFRGSRTSSERDPLILLSRANAALVDAKYTKNQAWKSDADTLYEEPAQEVSLEDHCQYKYLFNFRGVAASFRLKHLFLCRSLVFHGGDEWIEFFYPSMKPWIHFIPIKKGFTEADIAELLHFAKDNDERMQQLADKGHEFIWNNLRMEDVSCYWHKLLTQYGKLLKYKPTLQMNLIEVKPKNRNKS